VVIPLKVVIPDISDKGRNIVYAGPMGGNPMALLGQEGAQKDYYYYY
jgi:hypothetical protein